MFQALNSYYRSARGMGLDPVGSLLLLFGVVLLVFGQVVTFEFLEWDDNVMVTANDRIRYGITAASLAWLPTGIVAYSWHPLTNLTWMIDASLWGSWAGGFHLTNLLLHGLISALVWRLMLMLGVGRGIALAVALLFSVHPLRVEPAAWVTGRKDLMVTACVLLAMLAYLAYRARRTSGTYLIVSGAVAMAAMAKPLAIVTVPLMVWLDLVARADFGKDNQGRGAVLRGTLRALPEKLPWLLLTLLPAIMIWETHEASGAVLTPFSGSLVDRIAYPLLALGEYVRLTVWPAGLQFLHPMWRDYSGTAVALWAIVLVAISALAWRLRNEVPGMLLGWGWFLIALAPGVGVFRIGHHAIAERYVNLPHVGFVLAVVSVAAWAASRFRIERWAPAVLAATVAVLAVAAHAYAATWKTSETLFRHGVTITPANLQARKGLATYLAARGRVVEARDLFEALHRAPSSAEDPETAFELAWAYSMIGPMDRAELWFRRATELAPQVHSVWMARAQFFMGHQRYAEAARDFETALRLRPASKYGWVGLGYSLFYQGNAMAAESAMRKALDIDPGYAEPYFHLGVIAELRGEKALAQQHYQAALARNPRHEAAQRRLQRLFASDSRR